MLHHQPWIHILRNVAQERVQVIEAAIEKRSKADWVSWLNEGPAKGFSRQHRMSGTATGRIPTSKYEVDDLDGMVELESDETNLSRNKCQPVSHRVVSDGMPGSISDEVAAQTYAWEGEWACRSDSQDMQPVIWTQDMGPPPEQL